MEQINRNSSSARVRRATSSLSALGRSWCDVGRVSWLTSANVNPWLHRHRHHTFPLSCGLKMLLLVSANMNMGISLTCVREGTVPVAQALSSLSFATINTTVPIRYPLWEHTDALSISSLIADDLPYPHRNHWFELQLLLGLYNNTDSDISFLSWTIVRYFNFGDRWWLLRSAVSPPWGFPEGYLDDTAVHYFTQSQQ